MRQFNELLYFNKMMLSQYCLYFTLVFVLFSFQTSGSCSSISNICFVNIILYNQSVSLEVIVCYTEEDYFILLVHVSTILYIVILLFK